MARLEINNLTVKYFMKRTGWVTAVQDIDLMIESGQFVAIVGASGCGKTTLLNVVAGLVSPTAGQLLLDGQKIKGPGQDRTMVFQSPALMPWRTVMRNVIYGLELQGCPRYEACAQAQKYIDLVGLGGFEESYPRELSGGMQQRVNLARALTIQPKLLLLDEPLSALDAQTREYMQFELLQIWQQTQLTALYVTHQINEAIYLADQVVVMSARPGRIKAVIPVDLPRPRSLQFKRDPQFTRLEDHIWNLLHDEARKSGLVIPNQAEV